MMMMMMYNPGRKEERQEGEGKQHSTSAIRSLRSVTATTTLYSRLVSKQVSKRDVVIMLRTSRDAQQLVC